MSYKQCPLENDPLDLDSPVERGVQAINVDEITKLTREERLEVVRNAAKKASKACEAYFKANPLEPEPPMHRKQKAKLDKAKRKAERKRRLKAQRKNRKGGK